MAKSVGMNSFMAGKESNVQTMAHESYLMFRKLFRDNVSPDYEYVQSRVLVCSVCFCLSLLPRCFVASCTFILRLYHFLRASID